MPLNFIRDSSKLPSRFPYSIHPLITMKTVWSFPGQEIFKERLQVRPLSSEFRVFNPKLQTAALLIWLKVFRIFVKWSKYFEYIFLFSGGNISILLFPILRSCLVERDKLLNIILEFKRSLTILRNWNCGNGKRGGTNMVSLPLWAGLKSLWVSCPLFSLSSLVQPPPLLNYLKGNKPAFGSFALLFVYISLRDYIASLDHNYMYSLTEYTALIPTLSKQL